MSSVLVILLSSVHLYPWTLSAGGVKRYILPVHSNARRELIVVRQGDWKRMKGRCDPMCGWTWYPPSSLLYSEGTTPALSAHITVPSCNTSLIGWLLAWTFRKKLLFGDAQWHVFDRMTLYLFQVILGNIGWDFASTCRSNSFWSFVFSCCLCWMEM